MSSKSLIYVVDDDISTLNALERLLRTEFLIRPFSDPEVALKKMADEDPALVLADYTMPQMSGFTFLRKVRDLRPTSVRAIVSGFIHSEELSHAINTHLIHRFFMKPWENDVLRLQIIECLSQRETLLDRDKLAALALTDPVTGLGNHRLFQDQLKIEVERSKRHQRDLSLVMLDIDHFKSWNDHFGHPAGDELLRQMATLLLKGVRTIDWVARYGGDEFSLILPDTKISHAFEISERLRKSFEQSSFAKKGPVPLSLSLGIAAFPEHGQSAQDLVGRADQALYESKNAGRNQSKIAVVGTEPLN